MNAKNLAAAALIALVGLGLTGAIATAQEKKDAKSAGKPEMKLPPGWTMADMQACILAGTPGKMHQRLADGAGTWQGKQTMWMAPGAEPVKSDVNSTCTPIMDGRFVKTEFKGDIPGMGPYSGFGIQGYDNVSQEFASTWIDNHGTGIMNGTGKLSSDGKTLTTTYKYTCPLTKKPAVMRDIETITGSNTKTMEMFTTDPKSGKEYKMMTVEFTKK